jgi:hypothetical protein
MATIVNVKLLSEQVRISSLYDVTLFGSPRSLEDLRGSSCEFRSELTRGPFSVPN